MDVESELLEHEGRITRLETTILSISASVAKIEGSMGTIELLVKWVILPLLVIVAGLVGIKLVMPGA